MDDLNLVPRILVIGVGGAGGNAVNNMIESDVQGVEFVAANTDAQALNRSKADSKLQLGANLTKGLGAGMKPEMGFRAAEESLEDIKSMLDGANMCFIAAGMGGGTGTGSAPVIAKVAHEMGVLTVGVVTKPFSFEGRRRMMVADEGVAALRDHVDTLLVIPNQNLFRVTNHDTPLSEAFAMADDVLCKGVRSITDLMVMPGLINLDFADIKTVMEEMGAAMMGTGICSGDNRAMEAAEAAISNPLLDDVSIQGARGVLINITGGYDMTLHEVDEAAHHISNLVDPDATIILGSSFDPNIEGELRVSVVATGVDKEAVPADRPETVAMTHSASASPSPAAVSEASAQNEPSAALALQDELAERLNAQNEVETSAAGALANTGEKTSELPFGSTPAQPKIPTEAPAATAKAETPARPMPVIDDTIYNTPMPEQSDAQSTQEMRSEPTGSKEATARKSGGLNILPWGREAKPQKAERNDEADALLEAVRQQEASSPVAANTSQPAMPPQKTASSQAQTPAASQAQEEDLEIPAFLRRSMR